MRKFVAIAVLLAVPAGVFGSASFSVLSGGLTQVDVLPGATTLLIDVGLNTGTDLLTGINSAMEWAQTVGLPPTVAVGAGSPRTYYAPITLNAYYWSGMGPPDTLAGTAMAPRTGDVGFYNTIGDWGAINQTIMRISVDLSSMDAGDYYRFFIGDPGGGINVADQNGLPITVTSVGNLGVNVLPEPASILLLAGALPLLRRRR